MIQTLDRCFGVQLRNKHILYNGVEDVTIFIRSDKNGQDQE